METDFISNNSNNNNVKNLTDISINNQLNFIYNKTIKITFISVIYIKFILLDLNYKEINIKGDFFYFNNIDLNLKNMVKEVYTQVLYHI